jgi:hypothetical protein
MGLIRGVVRLDGPLSMAHCFTRLHALTAPGLTPIESERIEGPAALVVLGFYDPH